MNEITLNALINLFAIFSSFSKIDKSRGRQVFLSYIELHLGISASSEYLALYDEVSELLTGLDQDRPEADFITEAEGICLNLKPRLHRSEQVMLFLRFLELCSTAEEREKLDSLFLAVSKAFDISLEEYIDYSLFILENRLDLLDSKSFLSASNEALRFPTRGHLHLAGLSGEIIFLNINPINKILFIYRGDDPLVLDENPVQVGRFYAFKEGSILRGPRIQPVYFSDIRAIFFDHAQTAPFTLSAIGLEYIFPKGNTGLHPFSFQESSGQMIAIMGGSGVGKSTLLNILNGSVPHQGGHIYFNGREIQSLSDDLEGLIGYVPQDDLLFEDLSVWDNLYFSAKLCARDLSEEMLREAVTSVLQELELHEFKDLKVGSPLKKYISGGQRKRLNIALELIREPAILFADEPTSGLSSTDSEKVMLLLKHQARKGKLVIVNIHQPSSAIYKLFDKLWVMDKGGRVIYNGNPLDSIVYFKQSVNHVNPDTYGCNHCGNVSPEKIFEIVESRKMDSSGNFTAERRITPEEWHEKYTQSTENRFTPPVVQDTPLPRPKFSKPKPWAQFLVFARRNLKTKLTDLGYLFIILLEAPLLALIVAWFTRFSKTEHYLLLDNKNLISYLFMSIVVILFMGMSVSAEEIVRDRKILQRERFLHLSRFSYIHSKIIFLLLLSALQSLAFVLVGNAIIGIHGLTFSFWLILFSVAVFSNLLALNISAAFDSVVTIYVLIPLLLIPQILLCGIIVKFDDLQNKTADRDAVPIVGDLMVSRWAFEALAVEQFSSNKYNRQFFRHEKEMVNARYHAAILINELTGRTDHLTGRILQGEKPQSLARELTILKNMLARLDEERLLPPFQALNAIRPATFNDALAGQLKQHLRGLEQSFDRIHQDKREEKDQLVRQIHQREGKDYLFKLKQAHHNEAIENLVLNQDAAEFFRETPGALMRKIAPIYKKPEYKNGRAHFLASEKRIGNRFIPTFTFNTLVIWFMTLVLYISLQFNLLRKFINLFSKHTNG